MFSIILDQAAWPTLVKCVDSVESLFKVSAAVRSVKIEGVDTRPPQAGKAHTHLLLHTVSRQRLSQPWVDLCGQHNLHTTIQIY